MNAAPLPLDEIFDRFIDEITLTPDELCVARAHASDVAEILRPTMRPLADAQDDHRTDHLISGGVGKRTAIHPLPSVDLLYLLPADEMAIALLQESLAASFPEMIATPDRFLVALAGPTGTTTVCIRPTIERQGIFSIPVEGGWITSNPIAEMAALRVADSISDGRTTRLLLMLKAWKMECAVPLSSFAMEIMAREFMAEYGNRPWAGLLTDFLAWSRQRTPASFDLPGGLDRLAIDDAWHAQAESAYWRCVLAARHEAAGDVGEALTEWRHLLGPRFGAPPKFNMWKVQPDIGQDADFQEGTDDREHHFD